MNAFAKSETPYPARTGSICVARFAAALGCVCLFVVVTARAQQPAQPKTAAPTGTTSAAQKYFSDVELVNQHGEKMRLYSDLLKGKIVVINAFFATCQASCLPMNRNLEKLQEAFRERMGRDLFIVSISVDPETDTPPLLKEYARKLNAAPGRYFMTGAKSNVDLALRKLGQYVDNKENHTNIFIIGNESTGLWKKAFGLAKPEELVKIVRETIDDKGGEGALK